MLFRELYENEKEQALNLVWKVFLEYEALEYSKQGIDEFYESIHNPQYLSALQWYGGFMEDELIGVIATRNCGSHIALFFVNGKYHRKGIGKNLFELVIKDNRNRSISVNSSPFAVPIYHCLGFEDTDVEQVINGIRYTPMKLKLPIV